MQRLLLFAVTLLLAAQGFSQGMFGIEAGLGQATVKHSHKTPTLQAYYFAKISRFLYVGGTLSYQRYSFLTSYNIPATPASHDQAINIRQNSGYVFLSPTVDCGIGYRKYLHVRATFGLGLLADANQVSNRYTEYVGTKGTAYDTVAYNTTHDIPVLASRYSLGFSWRIPTGGYWNIMISSEYTHIPTNLTHYGPHLKTDYVSFTVGIMHKYPRVFVEY